MGDDYTDEDMFEALPRQAYSVRVGRGMTKARFSLATTADSRALLRELAKGQA
jgi:trehalose 6-phosphate synthase/phosphatase